MDSPLESLEEAQPPSVHLDFSLTDSDLGLLASRIMREQISVI